MYCLFIQEVMYPSQLQIYNYKIRKKCNLFKITFYVTLIENIFLIIYANLSVFIKKKNVICRLSFYFTLE